MPISATTNRWDYTGNGVTVNFAYDNLVFAASDLKVYVDGALQASGYTVSNVGEVAGGNVVFGVAPANGAVILIVSEIPNTNPTSWQQITDLPAKLLDKVANHAVRLIQQLAVRLTRTLRQPTTDVDDIAAIPVKATRAGKVGGYDGDGNPTVSTITLASLEGLASSAAAAAASALAAQTAETNAETAETNAETALAATELARDQAQAAANAGLFGQVQNKSADYSVLLADEGDLFRYDVTAATRTLTLPLIADLGLSGDDAFSVAVVKFAGSNNVTIARSGSNTINGATSASASVQYEVLIFTARAGSGDWTMTPLRSVGPGSIGTSELADSGVTLAKLATAAKTEALIVAASDEATALTTGTGKVTFRMPYAFTLTAVRASLATAQTSGSILTVDINEGGTTILSTKLTIDNGEKTSTTAATAAVISDAALADDAEITIDIDQIGDGTAKGLKVALVGYKP